MTIRRVPSDFVVEEELKPGFSRGLGADGGAGRFAVYRLTKTSIATPEAVAGFSRAMGVKPGAVGYGGLKDKHAVTVQHVSAAVGKATARVEGRGWWAELIGWSGEGVSTRSVEGNRFRIVVRDLSRGAAEEIGRRAGLLTDPASADETRLLIANYFGDQRFGSARHGEGFAAARLIKGDFEGAVKLLIATPARKDSGKRRAFTRELARAWGEWAVLLERLPRCPERAAVEALGAGGGFREAFAALPYQLQNLCVEAYQSHLWNAAARRIVVGLTARGYVLVAEDAFGEMVFPEATEVSREWREAEMPLLSPETALREPWGEAVRGVLQEEGIGLGDLRIPGVRRPRFDEHPRRLFVEVRDFRLGAVEADEMSGGKRAKREVGFVLPPGAFATVVLRGLGQ